MAKITPETKIYVAGHRGLVGSAIWANLQKRGFTNLVGRSHSELDLTDAVAVRQFFDEERPEAVILAAAHVGGILANNPYRADFICGICSSSAVRVSTHVMPTNPYVRRSSSPHLWSTRTSPMP